MKQQISSRVFADRRTHYLKYFVHKLRRLTKCAHVWTCVCVCLAEFQSTSVANSRSRTVINCIVSVVIFFLFLWWDRTGPTWIRVRGRGDRNRTKLWAEDPSRLQRTADQHNARRTKQTQISRVPFNRKLSFSSLLMLLLFLHKYRSLLLPWPRWGHLILFKYYSLDFHWKSHRAEPTVVCFYTRRFKPKKTRKFCVRCN